MLPVVLTIFFKLVFGTIIDPITGKDVFQLLIPGLFAYSGLLIIFLVSISFSEVREQGLLKRINTTPITSSEFMGSQIASNMIIAFIQIIITGILSVLLGFQSNATIIGIMLAYLIIIIYSLTSIGLGLIIATLAKNAQAAAGLSWIFIIPQQLFGTEWIPMSDATEIVGMFMPSYYVADALKLIFNGTLPTDSHILIDFVVISIISLVLIIIGIQLFKRYGKT